MVADRLVTHSGKNQDGDITSLGNPAEPWSPRSKADIIRDIEDGVHAYYTGTQERKRANVVVVAGTLDKYLFTDQDGAAVRHLSSLPDC